MCRDQFVLARDRQDHGRIRTKAKINGLRSLQQHCVLRHRLKSATFDQVAPQQCVIMFAVVLVGHVQDFSGVGHTLVVVEFLFTFTAALVALADDDRCCGLFRVRPQAALLQRGNNGFLAASGVALHQKLAVAKRYAQRGRIGVIVRGTEACT